MKEKITLTNSNSSEYFESHTEFKTFKVRKIKYRNPLDCPMLKFNWLKGPFGEIFSVPISEALSQQKNEFDIIAMAHEIDMPFNGPYKKIDIKIDDAFKNNESKVTFEVEMG